MKINLLIERIFWYHGWIDQSVLTSQQPPIKYPWSCMRANSNDLIFSDEMSKITTTRMSGKTTKDSVSQYFQVNLCRFDDSKSPDHIITPESSSPLLCVWTRNISQLITMFPEMWHCLSCSLPPNLRHILNVSLQKSATKMRKKEWWFIICSRK